MPTRTIDSTSSTGCGCATEPAACSCSTTAAGGSSMSFRELDQAVTDAVRISFGGQLNSTGGPWVWARDWDMEAGAGWAVVEIEATPGSESRLVRVPIGLDSDDSVVVGVSQAVDVDIEYVPVSASSAADQAIVAAIGDSALSRYITDHWPDDDRTVADVEEAIGSAAGITASTVGQIRQASISCPPVRVLEGFADVLPGATLDGLIGAATSDGCTRYGEQASAGVTAAGDDGQQMQEMRAELDELREVVEALANDMASMQADQLEPADVVAELPSLPTFD